LKNNNLILLQARTTSSRLKNKILLPIKNKPLFVYCYERLKKSNIKIICATSNHFSDNIVEQICIINKINYFRGDLKNVLKRFLDCTSKLDENTNIIRATADNPLPDSFFLKKCINIYIKKKLNFFFPDSNFFGLPYGLNLEIVKLKILRKIKKTKLNNEHITWDLKKNIFNKIKKNYFTHKNLSKFNFSIDTIDDYLSIKGKLEKYDDLMSYEKILENEFK
jgi:spore coat polysaccharide biosynthesis protein SpsF (cytidylyltransferase family)